MRIRTLLVAAAAAALAGGPSPIRADGGLTAPPPPPGTNGVPGTLPPTVGPSNRPSVTQRSAVIAMALSLSGSEGVPAGGLAGVPGAGSAWPRGTPVPSRGREPGWKFLPPVPADLLSTALLIFTSQHTSPYLSPEFIAAASLVEIGEPSHLAASASRGLGSGDTLIKYVDRAVLPLPERPALQGLPASPVEAMAQRLVFEDLSASFSHSQATPFAPRLLSDRSIAVGLLPRILEATKHAHPLVRRNAVHLLGSLKDEIGVEDELCTILETAEDPVCRFRAMRALSSGACARAGTILRRQIRATSDDYFRNAALHALGSIDPGLSRETARAVLRARRRDDDEGVWAALHCLYGSVPLDDASRDDLKRLEAALAAAEGSEDRVLDLSPALRPYRVCELRRIAWCALALSGEAAFLDRVLKAFDPGNDRRVLSRFPGVSPFMALDVLAKSAPQALWKVVRDEKESPDLRCRAILLASHPGLKELATEPKAALGLRLAALSKLAEGDKEAAAQAAVRMLGDYAESLLPGEAASVECAALTSARLLADLKTVNVGLLLRALDRALRDRDDRARGAAPAARVPLAESLLGMLASAGGPEAVTALRRILKTGRGGVAAEAALALGESNGEGLEADLLDGLEAADGWVRFCSYYSLKRLLKKDSPFDWIHSSAEARRAGVKTWRTWVAEKNP